MPGDEATPTPSVYLHVECSNSHNDSPEFRWKRARAADVAAVSVNDTTLDRHDTYKNGDNQRTAVDENNTGRRRIEGGNSAQSLVLH